MLRDKLNKYIEYFMTKLKIVFKEKKFYRNGQRLKYILEESKNSDDLIVVYSGIPRPGLKARYNYNRTLKNVKANRLFILDDFGYDQRGCFYLGKDGEFEIKEMVVELVDETRRKLGINRTFHVGSSKGGFASLYFGLQDKRSTIISGGPQYILGDHFLNRPRYMENTVPYILGKNFDEKDVKKLNTIVSDIIAETKGNDCIIHLHYSDKEYTYSEHVEYLINDLNTNEIKFQEDIAHYENHAEIAYHYPKFLLKTLRGYLK